MQPDHPTVVLISGASSGIGRACAEHLQRRGYRVYGTSRQSEAHPGTPFELIQMDVDDEASVQQAIRQVMEREGRLDVVVNNAGVGFGGAVEETSIEEARAQMETNFFGALRVCRAALPVMRAQHSGLIVNISSIGGLLAAPFQGLYCASKFALEGMSEALRMEVRPFGVRVVLIEPGDLRTGFTASRRRTRESLESQVYADRFTGALAVMEHDEQDGPSPEMAARLLERIIRTDSPRLRWVTGPASERIMPTLKKIMPPAFLEWVVGKHYRLR